MSKKTLRLDEIRFDGKTQAREEIDGDTVRDYAEAMKAGAEFPPLTIFFDGASNWLGDGFHRWHAAGEAGRDEIECDVRQGSKRDAVLYACGANQSHGLRRTNADKRKAVVAMLADSEWRTWSDRQIADHCGVGRDLVGDVRRQLSESDSSRSRLGADGRVRKLPERALPAVPKHTKPTPKGTAPDGVTAEHAEAVVASRLGQSEPPPLRSFSVVQCCPNCGHGEFAEDNDGEFCKQCKEPISSAPPNPQPAKVKSTVVAQCQALWDALTPAERIFAANWFKEQLG